MRFKPTLLLLLALPLTACAVDGSTVEPESAVELFIQANRSYLAAEESTEGGDEDGAFANYENAQRTYERLLHEGFAAPSLYYNLGNVYARLGRWGDAIWCYRNALRLTPRDADLIANLAYVREQARDVLPKRELPSSFRALLFWHYGLSLRETFVLAIVLYYILCAALALWFFFKSRFLRNFALVFAVFMLAFAASGGLKFRAEESSSQAVIVADASDVVSAPSDAAQTRFRLHSGAEVRVEETTEEWVKIFVDPQRRGWIRSGDCRLL